MDFYSLSVGEISEKIIFMYKNIYLIKRMDIII